MVYLCFELLTTNNQTKYKIKGESHTKDPLLQRYVNLTREKIEKFKSHEIMASPKEKNTRLDVVSKPASTGTLFINHSFIQETLGSPRIETHEVEMVIAKSMRCRHPILPNLVF